jgi:hypothetical protein
VKYQGALELTASVAGSEAEVRCRIRGVRVVLLELVVEAGLRARAGGGTCSVTIAGVYR